MDVIDIGLKVFDRLVDKYGEDPESRLLFLAGCMTGYKWFVINSDKTVLVSDGGISASWEDEVFTQINADLRADLRKIEEAAVKKVTDEIASGQNKFKDGDTYEFWSDTSNNININLKF